MGFSFLHKCSLQSSGLPILCQFFFHTISPPLFQFASALFPLGHLVYHDFSSDIWHYFHMASLMQYFNSFMLNQILHFSTLLTNHHVNNLLPLGHDFQFPVIWHSTQPVYPCPMMVSCSIRITSSGQMRRLLDKSSCKINCRTCLPLEKGNVFTTVLILDYSNYIINTDSICG